MNRGLVSVIVVNFNGRKWLKGCLDSLQKQRQSQIEVIIVDNGSSDGSQQLISQKYPQVKLVSLKTNLGFVAANNIGLDHSEGEFVVLLNNDTTVEEDFVF